MNHPHFCAATTDGGLLSASFQTHPPGYSGWNSFCCQRGRRSSKICETKGYINWINPANTAKYIKIPGTLNVLALANITEIDVQNWLHRFELAFGSLHIYSRLFFWKHQDSKTNVFILPPQNQASSALVLSWDLFYVPSWKTMDKRRQADGSEIPQENHLGFILPW